jgi:homogentisate 1,2-dioxygenase
MAEQLKYQSGFGNHFATEAIENALPLGQNSPQKCPFGLYAEQISGSAFTVDRSECLRSWVYRIRPSVLHAGRSAEIDKRLLRGKPFTEIPASPDQMRWDPVPIPTVPTDFVEGLVTFAGSGGYGSYKGCAAHIYACNKPMTDRFFYCADGDFLFVPETGSLVLGTEFGAIRIKPGEIAVIPRGIRFQVTPDEGRARGYICENYGPPFKLPQLGPIGANGLANPRDFLTPVASFEERSGEFQLVAKFEGNLWQSEIRYSPFDVVAWHGNYAPYKYDLSFFQSVNTVSFDHSDPSIFTVLTSPSEFPGVANVDFAIFPPRWQVGEHTFRPPYYHRNVMSEFMGLIFGTYDAKKEGFVPGGSSLHNCMSAHGPDAETFSRASTVDLKPSYLGDTLAFMFESSLVFHPTRFAAESKLLQMDYLDCWQGLQANFTGVN